VPMPLTKALPRHADIVARSKQISLKDPHTFRQYTEALSHV
jgi:hypothetical protein